MYIKHLQRLLLALCTCALLAACSDENTQNNNGTTADGSSDATTEPDSSDVTVEPTDVRVATFNASLYRNSDGALVDDLSGGDDAQARQVAEVLQLIRPDVVLINEFDWDADGEAARLFAEEYLEVAQNGGEPITYEYRYVPTTNTGISSGVDLNNNGETVTEPGSQAYGDDSFGFGQFPGQYGMVVYSRYPIDEDGVRSFQEFLWKDMPDSLLPTDFYTDQAIDVMRLSSKNHVDVPVDVNGTTLHILASHPTPPSFDGPEDRNGRRNHDEIRLWVDYISGGDQASYLTDDSGTTRGLDDDAAFVLLGDLNSDPEDGDSRRGALNDLLGHARTDDPKPTSAGAEYAGENDGGANQNHDGAHALDTADFNDQRVGNLRVDYALPSSNLEVLSSSVFWPAPDAENADLADVSDHHLVQVDVRVE